MRSSQEQEEFLDRGRFGEGEKNLPRTRGPCLMLSGVLLMAAGGAVAFSPRFHLVREIVTLSILVGLGSAASAVMSAFDRTGIASLITASTLSVIVGGAIAFLPVEKEGFGWAAGYLGAMVIAGSAVAALLGLAVFAFGAVAAGPSPPNH